jgi:endonuclease YncB( thermonuclease family)
MEFDFAKHDINTPEFTLSGKFLPGRLVDVTDGDSIVVVLPIFDNYYKYHVRINGIDTCEMKSKNEKNKKLALTARCEVLKLVTNQEYNINISKADVKDALNKNIYIVYLQCKDFDKYGRLLADVFIDNKMIVSISKHLIDKKLAYVYTGDTKLTEEQQIEIMSDNEH